MRHFDGREFRQTGTQMINRGDEYDRRVAERMQSFFEKGVADAKAGKPMLRTLWNIGSEYCSAGGTRYQRGYRSVLSVAEEAAMLAKAQGLKQLPLFT